MARSAAAWVRNCDQLSAGGRFRALSTAGLYQSRFARWMFTGTE